MPELILFDLGDVVCRFIPNRRLEALSAASNLTETDIEGRLWASGLASSFDRGDYEYDAQVAAVNEALATDLAPETLMDLWCHAFEIDSSVLTIARRLGANHRVGMLTNNPPLLRQAFQSHFLALEQTFDPILFSYEFRARKPDPAIFQAVEDSVTLAPESILLIDDSPQNVEAARRRRWQSIRFSSAMQLHRELTERGLR